MHKASTESPCGPNLLHCGASLKGSMQLSLQCCAWMPYRSLKEEKKNNPPCFHSSRVYIKALMIPTSRLFLTPGLLPTPVCATPASPHGNNLPFSSAAVVKHLAINCHCHTLQALTIYPSWRRKAEMVNCI